MPVAPEANVWRCAGSGSPSAPFGMNQMQLRV